MIKKPIMAAVKRCFPFSALSGLPAAVMRVKPPEISMMNNSRPAITMSQGRMVEIMPPIVPRPSLIPIAELKSSSKKVKICYLGPPLDVDGGAGIHRAPHSIYI